MDRLKQAKYVSGPHVAEHWSNGVDEVYLFGEDHRNFNQCSAAVQAEDAVELIKACAAEGVHVYVEMIRGYKSDKSVQDLVCVKSKGKHRKGVLNHLRTCLYIMKQRKPWLSIHFCDPRECFGQRSFSKEEDAFIASMVQQPDEQQLHQRFIVPLLRSDAELLPKLAPLATSLWHARVQSRRSQAQCAIKRHSVQLAATLYRQAFDDVMNLCALSEFEHIVAARGTQDSSPAHRTHVLYFGSAHIVALSQFLRGMQYKCLFSNRQPVNLSCVPMTA